MKATVKHLIEEMTLEFGLQTDRNGHIIIVLRDKDNYLEDRPNALFLTRGKKGWTSVKQSSYYGYELFKNDGRKVAYFNTEVGKESKQVYVNDYTNEELVDLINDIRQRGFNELNIQFGVYIVKTNN